MTGDNYYKTAHSTVRVSLVILFVLSIQFTGCTKQPPSLSEPTSASVVTKLEQGLRLYEAAQYDEALECYRSAALAASESDTLSLLADIHYRIGLTQLKREKYPEALESYGEALKLIRKTGSRNIEGFLLNSIGAVHQIKGEVASAKNYYEQALEICREVGDSLDEARTLANIGYVYFAERRYLKSLQYYLQADALFKKNSPPSYRDLGAVLTQTGIVYAELGQYEKALLYHRHAKKVYEQIDDRKGVAATLNNVGNTWHRQKDYREAIEAFEKALKIRKATGDRTGTAETLNNIALAYSYLDKAPQSVDALHQALRISQELKNFGQEAAILDSLGTVYKRLAQYTKSLEFYHQALSVWRELGNKSSELVTIGNIGSVLELMNQPELAIIFYKQSVNITEEVRSQLTILPENQQRAYVETVDHVYRSLADLLLKKRRVMEAIHVVDLLKVREIEQDIPTVRGGQGRSSSIPYLEKEFEIIEIQEDMQGQAIAKAKELKQLRRIPVEARTEDQKNRIAELYKFQRTLQRRFRDFIDSPDVLEKVGQLSAISVEQPSPPPGYLLGIWERLNRLGSETVLLYTLILEDRIELLLATPFSAPLRHTVQVPRDKLDQAIVDFRASLVGRTTDVAVHAKHFYDWLIGPIEGFLEDAHTETIIYLPDAKLRYIPLSALHDGDRWLIQRFEIFNITALSLSDLNQRSRQSLRVLAGAFTQGSHTVPINGQDVVFQGLRFAKREVDALALAVTDANTLVDAEFSRSATIPILNDYSVIHFATHAGIVPARPFESFILLGTGEVIRMHDVEELFLQNVELFVLSACETAVGNVLDDGREILGFSYLIEQAGAAASIASLWQVDDESTQRLMTAFYRALQHKGSSKANALRQAQMALISKGVETTMDSSRGAKPAENSDEEMGFGAIPDFSHPYYWAAFILIGNGF